MARIVFAAVLLATAFTVGLTTIYVLLMERF